MAPAETDKATEKELQRIRRLPENRVCPNCLKEESLGFSAVCTTFKTFICHDCKSAHQSFSHRCKSIQMSVWTLDEVKALDDCNGGGNAAAVRKYLRKVTPKDRVKQGSTLELYKRFIQRAYVDQRWADDEPEVLPAEAPETPATPVEEPKRRSRKDRHRKGKERTANTEHTKSDSVQAVPDGMLQPNAANAGSPSWSSVSPTGLEQVAQQTLAEARSWDEPYARHNQHAVHTQFFEGSQEQEYSAGRYPDDARRKWEHSPPLSAAGSWSTVWSTPTSKGNALPLDPTNPWAEDVLRLCEKQGHEVAGRFDLSPAMAGRNVVPSWNDTAHMGPHMAHMY